jgi:trans-aconitate methyltransferase
MLHPVIKHHYEQSMVMLGCGVGNNSNLINNNYM